MYVHLANDLAKFADLIARAAAAASDYLAQIEQVSPAVAQPARAFANLPEDGLGAEATLTNFLERFADSMTASAGPRYWGFVTGGTTPAALIGDWLATTYDINLADKSNSAGPHLELETIHLLRQMFGLPEDFSGVFVSGATLSNFVGLALGREWVSRQFNYSAAQEGLRTQVPVLSAEPHSSALKSLAMLGIGRSSLIRVAHMAGNREAMDVHALRTQLKELNGAPCIVIASAGTVNSGDFDDFSAIAALREHYPFWLHIDAAFGGFAACSPRLEHLMYGVTQADSITIDAHKWLNVPYDSAMIFTRHPRLQAEVFQNSAAYLPELGDSPDFFHLTPENSRRFRALAAWFTLMAYGKAGYREMVERHCDLAQELGIRIAASDAFRLLAPVHLNIVCFTFRNHATSDRIAALLAQLREDGTVFMTPTRYNGESGIRAALVNWRTTRADLDAAWDALERAYAALQA